MRFAAVVTVAAILYGCGEQKPSMIFRIDPQMRYEDARRTEKSIETLMQSCPGISRYSDDLRGELVTLQLASATDEREHGWSRAAHIELIVSEPPSTIPHDFYAAGQRCHFYVGVAEPFGVSISKSACASICLGNKTDASALFIPAHQ